MIEKIEKIQHMLAYIESNFTKEKYERFLKILNAKDSIQDWYSYLEFTYILMVK